MSRSFGVRDVDGSGDTPSTEEATGYACIVAFCSLGCVERRLSGVAARRGSTSGVRPGRSWAWPAQPSTHSTGLRRPLPAEAVSLPTSVALLAAGRADGYEKGQARLGAKMNSSQPKECGWTAQLGISCFLFVQSNLG